MTPLISRLYSDEFDGWLIGKDLEGNGIRVEWLMKTALNFSQGSLCPGRDSNWEPAEYKSVVLPLTQPTWAMGGCNYSSFPVRGV
jgi:hypothetical protein